MRIPGFALPYHLQVSKSHEKLVTEPLRPEIEVQFRQWDGVNFPNRVLSGYNTNLPIIFHQYPPPEQLLADPRFHLVWIPMWDHAKQLPVSFWRTLPKHIRIVAFSSEITRLAIRYKLKHLSLRFFLNPKEYKKASFTNGIVLFYWNRTGTYSAEFIEKICRELHVKKLIHQDVLDPEVPNSARLILPSNIGTTEVITISHHLTRVAYDNFLYLVNVYLAPRLYEGTGLSFLEALARGCAVFANDAATMNEYITHRNNGFLFSRSQSPLHLYIDLAKMGSAAHNSHFLGYRQWSNNRKVYSKFILEDWENG